MTQSQKKYYDEDRGPDQRKKVNNRNRWTVSEMWQVHHEIAGLILLGWKNVDIAEKLDVSEVMVSNVKNSPVVMDKLSIMRGARDANTIDLAKEIRETAPDALKLLQDIISGNGDGDNASINLRARTSEGMLDRAGYAAPKKLLTENLHGFFTSEDIAELKKRAKANDDVVDAEFKETI